MIKYFICFLYKYYIIIFLKNQFITFTQSFLNFFFLFIIHILYNKFL
nr:MAG TPA: hypothetical protein [Caudoviricetes sp.]